MYGGFLFLKEQAHINPRLRVTNLTFRSMYSRTTPNGVVRLSLKHMRDDVRGILYENIYIVLQ